jgi:hypothetical protein
VSNGTSIGAALVRLKEEHMSLNRIVALLTPLVFAPLAGVISTWAAENLPGVNVPPSAVEEIFIAGALIALAPAAQWLHGWQKWEAREAEARTEAARGVGLDGVIAAPVLVETVPEEIAVFEDVADDFGDLEDLDDLDELDDFDEFEDTSVSEDESVLTGS